MPYLNVPFDDVQPVALEAVSFAGPERADETTAPLTVVAAATRATAVTRKFLVFGIEVLLTWARRDRRWVKTTIDPNG